MVFPFKTVLFIIFHGIEVWGLLVFCFLILTFLPALLVKLLHYHWNWKNFTKISRCLSFLIFFFLELAKSVWSTDKSNYSAQQSFLYYFLVFLPLSFYNEILWTCSLCLLFSFFPLHVSELGEVFLSLSIHFSFNAP